MRGGSGGGNVVNVSISMNGQGQGSSQVTGDGMQGLGRSIGGLVQQHLQQEMQEAQQMRAQQSLTDQARQLAGTPLMDASKDPDAKQRIDNISQAIQPPQE